MDKKMTKEERNELAGTGIALVESLAGPFHELSEILETLGLTTSNDGTVVTDFCDEVGYMLMGYMEVTK